MRPNLTKDALLYGAEDRGGVCRDLLCFRSSMHFVKPDMYLKIMPPYGPWHLAMVRISGAFEILSAAWEPGENGPDLRATLQSEPR
jgi:hypothetical protein